MNERTNERIYFPILGELERVWLGEESCRHLIVPGAEVGKYVWEHRVWHLRNLAVQGKLLGGSGPEVQLEG